MPPTAIPVPAKPSSAAAQALAAPHYWSAEPPDFPDFEPTDTLPPDNWDEPDFAAGKPTHATSPVTTATTRSNFKAGLKVGPKVGVEAGNEITAIRHELENRKQHLLLTALEEVQLHYEPGVLRVTMASDDAWAKRLRDAAATFREVGAHLFGQPLRVELSFNSQVTTLVHEAAQTRANTQEQAKQNPAVRLLLDKFKGEIVHVRAQTAGGSQ